jgi:hypothetical protein
LQRRLSNGPDHAMTTDLFLSQPLAKSQSHHGLLSMTASTGRSGQSERNNQSPGTRALVGASTDLGTSSIPRTGLSLAYDLHVRKSKSSQALLAKTAKLSGSGRDFGVNASRSTSRSGSLNATTTRPGFAHSSSSGYQYRRNERTAPRPPTGNVLPSLDSLSRAPIAIEPSGSAVPTRTPRPLPIPPVGIARSHSSSLLRPTASSLARMQATIQPPSMTAGTPRTPVTSQQKTPFSRGISTSTSTLAASASVTSAKSGTPHKKASFLVPKSPHRRAMEKHTAAGRVVGASGGIAGAYKSKTSAASLAMSQKQREIEERRRARAHEGMPLF